MSYAVDLKKKNNKQANHKMFWIILQRLKGTMCLWLPIAYPHNEWLFHSVNDFNDWPNHSFNHRIQSINWIQRHVFGRPEPPQSGRRRESWLGRAQSTRRDPPRWSSHSKGLAVRAGPAASCGQQRRWASGVVVLHMVPGSCGPHFIIIILIPLPER